MNRFLVITLVVLLLIIGGEGVYYLQLSKKKINNQILVTSITITPASPSKPKILYQAPARKTATQTIRKTAGQCRLLLCLMLAETEPAAILASPRPRSPRPGEVAGEQRRLCALIADSLSS
jgi:hypothetical protein